MLLHIQNRFIVPSNIKKQPPTIGFVLIELAFQKLLEERLTSSPLSSSDCHLTSAAPPQ